MGQGWRRNGKGYGERIEVKLEMRKNRAEDAMEEEDEWGVYDCGKSLFEELTVEETVRK